MNLKKYYFQQLLSIFFVVSLISSCTTEDVSPTIIEVTSTNLNLNEDNGTLKITVVLNSTASNQISLPLIINGTATLNVDYSISDSQIIINKGSNSGEITLTGLDDVVNEPIETIEISIGSSDAVIMLQSYVLNILVLDNDTDTDNDGVVDSLDECPTVAGDITNNGCPFLGFLINEVLYDPDNTITGDANGDGTRDANEDEFIEFFNSGPALNLSGYTIFDSTGLSSNTPRHTFPTGTIVPSNKAIVVFGGGTPTGNFGGSIVQVASGGQINMNNAGDIVTVKDAAGNVILTFDLEPLSDNPNESYTRNPDISGDFIQHSTITAANGVLFSPGRKINGTSF
jgi:hypothetical protein